MSEDLEADSVLLVGRVWRAHGLTGAVKVVPETDEPARFTELSRVFAGPTASDARPLEIEDVRFQPTKKGTLVIVKLAGVDTRESAEALAGTSVFARQSELPPLQEGDAFLHELIGLRAVRETGEDIGTVDDVLELPGHDVIVIGRPGRPSALVPAVPEFVVEVDIEDGRLVIRPIEGLLDEQDG